MTRPIRVLQMIGSLNIGGSQAAVLSLYKAINRDLLQFDFIIDKPDETELAPIIKSLGGKVYSLPSFKGTNIIEIKRAWNSFFEEHPEYHVLHSHVRSYASLYFPVAKKHGVKTIIHSHSTSNGSGISALAKKILQYPLRFQADYYIACSKEAGEWLFGKRITKNSKKYHMLQNAIDISKYECDVQRRQELRKMLGVEGKTVFIHVGRLHPSKNHSFLIDVFSEIAKQNNDATLFLVGDGELKRQIEQKIHEKRLDDKIVMLGARNDVPELLMAADCFLFPSLWEGLPVTVVEAQASGLPCLVSDHVTNDVFVSDIAHKVPVDQGIDKWVDCINTIDMQRKDVRKQIKSAGFDIHETSNWITNLYLSMSK